jgi:methionyl-tRNA formyltransferase
MKKDSIVFFGTPLLAVFVLDALEENGIIPDVIVCAEDKPVGRKKILTSPPTKIWAEERNIPFLQIKSFKEKENLLELYNTEWDFFIVAAYNKILPKDILSLPRYGTLNVHPSLLPLLRGPSPIRSALLFNQKEAVGVSIILLDEEIDHGPLLAQGKVELPEWPIEGHILDKILFTEGGNLLAEVLPLWKESKITPEEQNHRQATFTKKFEKNDGEIDFKKSDEEKYCLYCAMDSWPQTFFFDKEKKRVKIVKAEMKNGVFTPLLVIPEGKKEIKWSVYLKNQKEK